MKPLWLLPVLALALAGCSTFSGADDSEAASPAGPGSREGAAPTISSAAGPPELPDYGTAPELHRGIWLNTDKPLYLADLRGRVILLEMWTFGCFNCRNVIPALRDWHQKYAAEGLVVIGNHYPEFSYERDLDNLKEALIRLEITYPVLQDNDRETWGAYENRYWPTLYLIDKEGKIRYRHIGEGRYAETEAAILALLAEP